MYDINNNMYKKQLMKDSWIIES